MPEKICRVCGKTYPACKDTTRNPKTAFRWREVACSIGCGTEYFKQIEENRNDINKSEITINSNEEDFDEDETVSIFDIVEEVDFGDE